MQGVAVCSSDMLHLSFLGASKRFGVWVEKWDCRCEERWLAQSTGVWQFEKLGRSEVVGEAEPEMERSREKTLGFLSIAISIVSTIRFILVTFRTTTKAFNFEESSRDKTDVLFPIPEYYCPVGIFIYSISNTYDSDLELLFKPAKQ